MATLPEHLRAPLAAAEFVTSPALDEIVRRVFVTPDGVGGQPRRPPSYRYQEFGRREGVVAVLRGFDPRQDDRPAYFRPHGSPPAFRVRFGWARQRLTELFEWSPEGLAVVTEDLSTGVTVNQCCGHPADNPDGDEVVYEVGLWRPDDAG